MSKGQALSQTIKNMLANPHLDGRIAAAACSFSDKPDSERGSVLSTAQRNLKFLDYDSIRDVLGDHDFDLSDLKQDHFTLYLCLPAILPGMIIFAAN